MTSGETPNEPHADVLALLSEMGRELAEAPWIGSPAYAGLGASLRQFAPASVISAASGLLTVSAHQTATARIELLVHLAALHCDGKRKPKEKDLRNWVNRDLARLPIRRLEDPPEDVFVSNVMAGSRNYRLFEGTWESNDYYLQQVLDCIGRTEWGRPFIRLRARIIALLSLSDAVAERAGLRRWATTEQDIPKDVILGAGVDPNALARLVTFDSSALAELGVSLALLKPFVFAAARRGELAENSSSDSALVRRPIALFGDNVVLALPTAVSAAIRYYVLEWVEENNCEAEFQRLVRLRQRDAALEVAASRIAAPSNIAGPQPGAVRVGDTPASIIAESIVALDTDKLAHLVLLGDDLAAVRADGLTSPNLLQPEHELLVGQYLHDVAEQLEAVATGGGLSIVIRGGVGRGGAMELDSGRGSWHVIAMSLADFDLFAASEGASLLRLWKLREQLALLKHDGCEVTNLSGELNLYAYWRDTDYLLAPVTLPYPYPQLRLSIGTNHLYGLRVEQRRVNDVHVAPFDSQGRAAEVRRLHLDPYFAALSNRPIYGAEELARRAELVGVVETSAPALWIQIGRPRADEAVRSFAHDIWDATLTWMDRLLPAVHRSARWEGNDHGAPINVTLHLKDETEWAAFSRLNDDLAPERPRLVVRPAEGIVDVHVPLGFCALLHRAANDGERALLEELVVALFQVVRLEGHSPAAERMDRSEAARLVADCMGGSEARALHVFNARHTSDFIAPVRPPPARIIQPEARAPWARALAWRAIKQPKMAEGTDSSIALTISGVEEAGQFLNTVVARLWQGIKIQLIQMDSASMVEMLLGNIEAIHAERQHWRRTARAVAGLHGQHEDVAAVSARRESDRAHVSLASRVLIEMAICTSKTTGGRVASLDVVDGLVAAVALMVELAADSDAIRGGFTTPEVRVFQNGVIACDEEFLRGVVVKYGLDAHATEFRGAIGSYDDLFATATETAETTDMSGPANAGFNGAFLAEFEIAPDRFISGLAELLDLAYHQMTLLVSTTCMAVKARLTSNRQFSPDEAEAFIRMLLLVPRRRWDEAPPGYTARDWYPWRFRRRLSVVARPLICVDGSASGACVYGVQQLAASVSYLFSAIRGAWFPEEYFTSGSMQRFRGATADSLGHGFAHDVAADLRNAGYTAHDELQMSTLGAPAELGDLDVVAWRRDESRVWLIECKRQMPARTVGEIVERLNQFRGESDDLLAKHLRRVEWVRANATAVADWLGLPITPAFTPVLCTNISVPMQFSSNIKLPTDQITTRDQLFDTLDRLGHMTE